MTKVNQQELIERVEALMADAEEVGFDEAHNMAWSDKAPLTLADIRALQSLLAENAKLKEDWAQRVERETALLVENDRLTTLFAGAVAKNVMESNKHDFVDAVAALALNMPDHDEVGGDVAAYWLAMLTQIRDRARTLLGDS